MKGQSSVGPRGRDPATAKLRSGSGAPTGWVRVPVGNVTRIMGGLSGVLDYLRNGTWKHDSNRAILIWRADTGGWYVFDRDKFKRLARSFVSRLTAGVLGQPWKDLAGVQKRIQDEFNIHETTARPPIRRGEWATLPTVELAGSKAVAVWLPHKAPDISLGGGSLSFGKKPSSSLGGRFPSKIVDLSWGEVLPGGTEGSGNRRPSGRTPPSPRPTSSPRTRRPPSKRGGKPKPSPKPSRPPRQPTPPSSLAETPAVTDTIRRTPHLDVSPPRKWIIGMTRPVEVYLDTHAAKPDEDSEPAEIPARPGQKTFKLLAWLTTSSHFKVTGNPVKPLTVFREKDRSTSAVFSVECVQVPGENEPVVFTASLDYQGRPCGRVKRILQSGKVDKTPNSPPSPGPVIQLKTADKTADLVVQIVRPSNGSSAYEVRVTSRLSPKFTRGVRGRWPLENAEQWVASCFAQFAGPDLKPLDRYEFLRGAGMALFKGAPDVFREVFWNLVSQADLAPQLRSIFIMSDEPYVPWELMIPHGGPSGVRNFSALGSEFIVGRWSRDNGQPPPQSIVLDQTLVVAPTYENGNERKLANSGAEAALVTKTVPGTTLSPVKLQTLRDYLPTAKANLLHFICHGNAAGSTRQSLSLDDVRLDTLRFRGMEATESFFKDRTPFVFLNACDVGRMQATLLGPDGFAPLFIGLGASAVIAPLWAIDDQVAHSVAMEFYEMLGRNRTLKPAELLSQLRERAYSGKTQGVDTYAAYCFYGDPLAVLDLKAVDA